MGGPWFLALVPTYHSLALPAGGFRGVAGTHAVPTRVRDGGGRLSGKPSVRRCRACGFGPATAVVREEDRRLSAAWPVGIETACGGWVVFRDAEDAGCPDGLRPWRASKGENPPGGGWDPQRRDSGRAGRGRRRDWRQGDGVLPDLGPALAPAGRPGLLAPFDVAPMSCRRVFRPGRLPAGSRRWTRPARIRGPGWAASGDPPRFDRVSRSGGLDAPAPGRTFCPYVGGRVDLPGGPA